MPIRRRLSYIAASVIAAAGMVGGHALAGADGSALAEWLGIVAWVAAGVAAVLIDPTVPARAVGFASLALPLVWFGMLLVSEDRSLWFIGLLFIGLFALVAGLSAAGTKLLLNVARRRT